MKQWTVRYIERTTPKGEKFWLQTVPPHTTIGELTRLQAEWYMDIWCNRETAYIIARNGLTPDQVLGMTVEDLEHADGMDRRRADELFKIVQEWKERPAHERFTVAFPIANAEAA